MKRILTDNDVTDEQAYHDRRNICKGLALAGLLPLPALGKTDSSISSAKKNTEYGEFKEITDFKIASTYNNFYEFSLKKDEPYKLAKNFKTRPWSLTIDGEVAKPQVFDLDALLKKVSLEERIYRFRCVEAWSMVIPWIGFPIHKLMSLVEPKPEARYLRFETLYDPEQFPGQKPRLFGSSLRWPYVEGLTLDEAKNDLAMMVVGMYGSVLPNQNGAPLRLIVPWKYGFKSIKSVVKISFTKKQPKTSWNLSAPKEYGFYANVNPKVDHPRWSQKTERLIMSGSLFSGTKRVPTQSFNGYAEQVAGLYTGLDLKKNY